MTANCAAAPPTSKARRVACALTAAALAASACVEPHSWASVYVVGGIEHAGARGRRCVLDVITESPQGQPNRWRRPARHQGRPPPAADRGSRVPVCRRLSFRRRSGAMTVCVSTSMRCPARAVGGDHDDHAVSHCAHRRRGRNGQRRLEVRIRRTGRAPGDKNADRADRRFAVVENRELAGARRRSPVHVSHRVSRAPFANASHVEPRAHRSRSVDLRSEHARHIDRRDGRRCNPQAMSDVSSLP